MDPFVFPGGPLTLSPLVSITEHHGQNLQIGFVIKMKIFGYDRKNEEDLLVLGEATISVTNPKRLREIAQFFQETADLLEKFGEAFGHEHFCDFCKRNKIGHIREKEGDIIIARAIKESQET